MSWLQRLAAEAPVPVYIARGTDASDGELAALALDAEVEITATPRHAAVLLVAGHVPPEHHNHLRRLHEQLPPPAATLWYRSEPLAEFDQPDTVTDGSELRPALRDLHRRLYDRPPPPALLPDEPPVPWRGVGENGQGGEGMMGGNPYGRPMAMTAEDLRDGLQLDALGFTIGPFFRPFPPGLIVQMTLQGDVVQGCSIQSPPFDYRPAAEFGDALRRPVPIAELELARARCHLYRLAHALEVVGLSSLARRALRQATELHAQTDMRPLRRWLKASGLFRSAPAGCGRLSRTEALRIGGTAARAAGQPTDARLEDPAYGRLGFSVVRQHDGDCRARWSQWLDEIDQSLHLAARAAAENACTAQRETVETPRGRWRRNQGIADASAVLEQLLPGLEWSEAMATIASLDLAGVDERGP